MLSTSLLLAILCLYFVKSQHVSLPRAPRDAECRLSDMRLIQDYFETTTVIRNQYTIEPKYCTDKTQFRIDSSVSYPYPKINLDTVIYLYSTLDYVNSYKYINCEGPVIQDGFISINNDELLPLYEVADIRRKHLECHNSQTGFGEDVDAQMSLMGRRNTDYRARLLAHSLGGTSRALNVIPMAVNIYMHPHFEITTNLGEPLADWRSNEFWIRKFLKHFHPNGRVEWKMAVQYEDNVFVKPRQVKSYRPLRFSIQYTAYTDQNDNTSVYYTSPNITFLNDNHHTCKAQVISFQDGDDERPPNCDIQMAKSKEEGTKKKIVKITKVKIYNYLPTQRFCCPAVAGFTYLIQRRMYSFVLFRALRDDNRTFYDVYNIAVNNRTVGIFYNKISDSWSNNFAYTFPFHINGKQYMYAHCNDDNSYTIRELTQSGMGAETKSGTWPKSHLTCAPFTISGKQYFYSQRTDKTWFIRELLPDGQMGEEKSNDKWPQIYTVVFSYVINSKHMLYAHNPETTEWFVRELLPDGQMGDQLNNGKWPVGYSQSLKLTLNEQQFIYALNTEQPYDWFVRELLPDGEIGSILDSGTDDAKYNVVYDYLNCSQINCVHYVHKIGQNPESEQVFMKTDFLYWK